MGISFKDFNAFSIFSMPPVKESSSRESQQVGVATASTDLSKGKQARWLLLAILVTGLIAFSYWLAYLLQGILAPYQAYLSKFALLAYLTIFTVMLLGNLTIVAPVPLTLAIMVAAASNWDPLLVALFASLGGSIGELSGYYAGYFGKTKIMNGYTSVHDRIAGWMHRYGSWSVFLLALQPVIPFDLAGLVAGASKMPLFRFWAALWAGKLIKYSFLCFSGVGFVHLLPF